MDIGYHFLHEMNRIDEATPGNHNNYNENGLLPLRNPVNRGSREALYGATGGSFLCYEVIRSRFCNLLYS